VYEETLTGRPHQYTSVQKAASDNENVDAVVEQLLYTVTAGSISLSFNKTILSLRVNLPGRHSSVVTRIARLIGLSISSLQQK